MPITVSPKTRRKLLTQVFSFQQFPNADKAAPPLKPYSPYSICNSRNAILCPVLEASHELFSLSQLRALGE